MRTSFNPFSNSIVENIFKIHLSHIGPHLRGEKYRYDLMNTYPSVNTCVIGRTITDSYQDINILTEHVRERISRNQGILPNICICRANNDDKKKNERKQIWSAKIWLNMKKVIIELMDAVQILTSWLYNFYNRCDMTEGIFSFRVISNSWTNWICTVSLFKLHTFLAVTIFDLAINYWRVSSTWNSRMLHLVNSS